MTPATIAAPLLFQVFPAFPLVGGGGGWKGLSPATIAALLLSQVLSAFFLVDEEMESNKRHHHPHILSLFNL
jgi:hypothetical protein